MNEIHTLISCRGNQK